MALRNPMSGRMLGSDRATLLRMRGPYLEGTAQLEESRKYQDTAVEQANRRLGIMQGELDAANAALAENIRQNKITEGMTREQIENQEEQTRKANIISGVSLGIGTGSLGLKAYDLFKPTPTTPPVTPPGTPPPISPGTPTPESVLPYEPSPGPAAPPASPGLNPYAKAGLNIAGGIVGGYLSGQTAVRGGKAENVGQKVGSSIGAIAGSFIPVPFVGPALGSFVGGNVGAIAGSLYRGGGKSTEMRQGEYAESNMKARRQWYDAKSFTGMNEWLEPIQQAFTGATSDQTKNFSNYLAVNLKGLFTPKQIQEDLYRRATYGPDYYDQLPGGGIAVGGKSIKSEFDYFYRQMGIDPTELMKTPTDLSRMAQKDTMNPEIGERARMQALSPSQRNIENQFQTSSGTIDFFTGQAMP